MKKLSDGEIAEFLRKLKENNWSRVATARALGIGGSTVTQRVHTLRTLGYKIPDPPRTVAKPPVDGDATGREVASLRSKLEATERALEIERAKNRAKPIKAAKSTKRDYTVVIRPDLHGSYQDKAAVGAYLAAVRDVRPDMILGLGDLIDAGSFLAAHHVLGYVADGAYSVDDDVAAAAAFLDAEQDAGNGCRRVEIEGNHDHRIEQWCITQAQRNGSGDVRKMAEWLLSKFGPEALFNYKQRGVEYIKRGDMHGELEPGTYRFRECLYTHGNFTGVDCCARALNAYGTNVVFGHTHRSVGYVRKMGHRPIGAWTVGCLSQLRRFWNHGKPTDWTHGFGIQTWSGDLFQHSNIVIHKGQALLHGVAA